MQIWLPSVYAASQMQVLIAWAVTALSVAGYDFEQRVLMHGEMAVIVRCASLRHLGALKYHILL